MANPAILVNLERCTGCWTCAMACKIGNNLPDEKWWSYVRTLGDGQSIDEPEGHWPNLKMSWMLTYTEECTLCPGRAKKREDPYCVYNCPTEALTYGDKDDPAGPLRKRMEELKQKGFRFFQLEPWERTRPEIFYAKR